MGREDCLIFTKESPRYANEDLIIHGFPEDITKMISVMLLNHIKLLQSLCGKELINSFLEELDCAKQQMENPRDAVVKTQEEVSIRF